MTTDNKDPVKDTKNEQPKPIQKTEPIHEKDRVDTKPTDHSAKPPPVENKTK